MKLFSYLSCLVSGTAITVRAFYSYTMRSTCHLISFDLIIISIINIIIIIIKIITIMI